MDKEKLIAIYADTKEKCISIEIPLSAKVSALVGSGLVGSGGATKNGIITFDSMDTVSAIVKYKDCGKTAILNMANAFRKGGGVEKGSIAQEECLFRCSNLFTIKDEFYPMAENELIYTKNTTFIKDFYYNDMEPVQVDVITIAAPNLNKAHGNTENSEEFLKNYDSIMLKKINAMFDIAAINGCDNIILGAWGCGAFKNDPLRVSKFFNEVLTQKHKMFDNVIFAIINDRNSVGDNYNVFLENIQAK